MPLDAAKVQELQDVANKMRVSSVRMTTAANSGHPTSCASGAEAMAVLFFHTMRYDPKKPRDASSDRFVMSKGHAAPLLYAAWKEVGLLSDKDIMSLRKIDSDIEGHPTPRLEFVDVATGSLGQGMSCAAGMAYTGKNFDKASYRVYCMIGDGESAEGSIWEALHFASHYKLDNLVAVFDVNRLGQSEATSLGHQVDVYKARLDSFGWNAIVVDGHDVTALANAFAKAESTKGKPTAIVAKTFKGHGFAGISDVHGFHGKPLAKPDEAIAAINGIIKNGGAHKLTIPAPVGDAKSITAAPIKLSEPPNYKLGDKHATRMVYGDALVKLGKTCDRVIALDGDVKNSTGSEKFLKAFPDRKFCRKRVTNRPLRFSFIECYIAEQNLVGVAIGCATRDRTVPFVSTFATFFTRAFDQLRMGVISQTNINCSGSHVGVSIGEDGPSQMALEDIAMFRSLPGSTVFYPADAVSAERSVELAANTKGITFIRTSRPTTPVIYKNDEEFSIGKAKVVKEAAKPKAVVVGAGVTLFEALKAAETVEITVIDPFTVKPLDKATILAHAKKANGRVITVEDHYPQGGLGEAVASALAMEKDVTVQILAVTGVPRSGPSDALLDMFGISAACIVKAVNA